jgi:hypothetical protein
MLDYQILPERNGWRVQRGRIPHGFFATQEEAMAAALRAARAASADNLFARVTAPGREIVVVD